MRRRKKQSLKEPSTAIPYEGTASSYLNFSQFYSKAYIGKVPLISSTLSSLQNVGILTLFVDEIHNY